MEEPGVSLVITCMLNLHVGLVYVCETWPTML